jgi:hypothetical protein
MPVTTRYSDLFASPRDATGLTQVSGAELPSAFKAQLHKKLALIPVTIKGGEIINDVVLLLRLNKGSIVIPHESFFQCPVDPGTAISVTVGDLDSLAPSPLVDSDADRYSAAVALNAATTTAQTAFAGGVAQGNYYELQEDTWITMTYTAATTPAGGGMIIVGLAYYQIL